MKHKGSSTSRKQKSLCEKSMILVSNIIKLSSLSLGNTNLGTTTNRPPPNPAEAPAKDTKLDVPDHQSSRSPIKRSQESETESKPFCVVMQPSTDQNTSTTTSAPTIISTQPSYASKNSKSEAGSDVNCLAEDYIKRTLDNFQNQAAQAPAPKISKAPAPKISKQHYYS